MDDVEVFAFFLAFLLFSSFLRRLSCSFLLRFSLRLLLSLTLPGRRFAMA